MSTITKEFTKEQLIAKAQEQIKLTRGLNLTLSAKEHVDMCSALFEIALASLEAEIHSYTFEDDPRPLYTAPPAPVSLTEEQRAMLRDMDDEIIAELDEEERGCRADMLQGAEPSKMSGIMPDYEGSAMTQRELFQAGWEAHHAAMLQAGAPVQFGWSKGHFGYHTLFNAIGKAVNIQGGALLISVGAFEDAMLAAAPQQEVK